MENILLVIIAILFIFFSWILSYNILDYKVKKDATNDIISILTERNNEYLVNCDNLVKEDYELSKKNIDKIELKYIMCSPDIRICYFLVKSNLFKPYLIKWDHFNRTKEIYLFNSTVDKYLNKNLQIIKIN